MLCVGYIGVTSTGEEGTVDEERGGVARMEGKKRKKRIEMGGVVDKTDGQDASNATVREYDTVRVDKRKDSACSIMENVGDGRGTEQRIRVNNKVGTGTEREE
ncbi:hypothetical protein BC629DRAFT_1443186 [Irpex lacteus]|nr:hypothetical protein BC629DRAFT_1443186 [Irpex lacteus]